MPRDLVYNTFCRISTIKQVLVAIMAMIVKTIMDSHHSYTGNRHVNDHDNTGKNTHEAARKCGLPRMRGPFSES